MEESSIFEKLFKLKQNGTTIKTEVVAGLTTFLTMAYIVALNPNLLVGFGLNSTDLWKAVFFSTCFSAAVGTIIMAFLANKPFAMAPGMGLNSFFASLVAGIAGFNAYAEIGTDPQISGYTKAFQTALIIIVVEGIVFIILSIVNVREKIVEAIPLGIRLGISPAIGLMLLNIGFGSNAGVGPNSEFYAMKDFFGALSAGSAKDALGENYGAMVLTVVTMFIGLFIIIALNHYKVKASVILGMLGASVINWAGQAIFLDTNPFKALQDASWLPPVKEMASTTAFWHLGFDNIASIGWGTFISLIITFCIIDMFDTIGTLVGTASRATIKRADGTETPMLDENGKMPQMKEALISDAVGTIVGGCTGTSTVTTFIESASGVEAGGRTGLTALVTGVCFLLCLFLSPIAAIIPAAATSAALIYVGILMVSGLSKVDFSDIFQTAPVAIMLIAMPVSGSIGHAIGLGIITYTVMKLCARKFKDVSILTYVISAIFLVKFFVAF